MPTHRLRPAGAGPPEPGSCVPARDGQSWRSRWDARFSSAAAPRSRAVRASAGPGEAAIDRKAAAARCVAERGSGVRAAPRPSVSDVRRCAGCWAHSRCAYAHGRSEVRGERPRDVLGDVRPAGLADLEIARQISVRSASSRTTRPGLRARNAGSRGLSGTTGCTWIQPGGSAAPATPQCHTVRRVRRVSST